MVHTAKSALNVNASLPWTGIWIYLYNNKKNIYILYIYINAICAALKSILKLSQLHEHVIVCSWRKVKYKEKHRNEWILSFRFQNNVFFNTWIECKLQFCDALFPPQNAIMTLKWTEEMPKPRSVKKTFCGWISWSSNFLACKLKLGQHAVFF